MHRRGNADRERPATRGRRRRWWRPLIGVIVALALIAGAGELAVRLLVPGIVASAVREKLALSDEHPVDVELGGAAIVPVVTGRLGDVTVTVDDAELFDGLVGDVRLHADSVPFDYGNGEISGGAASLTLARAQLPAAIKLLTQGVADGGKVQGGELLVSREVSLFGVDVPLQATLVLSVRDGDVVIQPKGIGAVGFDLSAKKLRKLTGGAFDGMLTAHDVCVRDRLPAGIELTGIDLLSTGAAKVTVAVSPGILSDATQREPGKC